MGELERKSKKKKVGAQYTRERANVNYREGIATRRISQLATKNQSAVLYYFGVSIAGYTRTKKRERERERRKWPHRGFADGNF